MNEFTTLAYFTTDKTQRISEYSLNVLKTGEEVNGYSSKPAIHIAQCVTRGEDVWLCERLAAGIAIKT